MRARGSTGSATRDRLLVGLVSVTCVLVSAGLMVSQGQIPFTSDQAVPALMALDIRDHGAHPVFHWGVFYNGTLEPHLLSLVFRFLPAGVSTYRLFLTLLVAATVILAGETCRRAWGLRAGIAGAAYLGLGPSFFFYKGLTSDGAYTSVLTALAAGLLAASVVADDDGPRVGPVAALGFFSGLAWWIQPISAAFAPVVGLAVAWRFRSWLRPSLPAVLFASFLCGSAPWWVENLRLGFPSLRMPELAAASTSGALEQARDLLTDGWPMLLGARSAHSEVPTFPGAAGVALILVVGLVLAASGRLRRREADRSGFLLAASIALVVTPPLLALAIARTDLKLDVRFLIPSYLGLAPLVAFGALRLVDSGRGALAVVLGVVLTSLGPASQIRAPRFDDLHEGLLRESSEAAVSLQRMGAKELYGSYWQTHRLAFLGRGDLVPASFGQESHGTVRNPAFQKMADASTRPVFLLSGLDGARLVAFARSRGWDVRRTALPRLGLTVVTDLPGEALEVVRRCRCIPAAVGPDSVEWLGIEGPGTLRQGSRAKYRVSFRVNGHASIGPGVRLAPRWRAFAGEDFGRDGRRVQLPRASPPDGTFVVDVPVEAFVAPGRYRLTIDLVEEHVTWFEWRGIVPPFLEVEVTP
jgi:hypothetical protein